MKEQELLSAVGGALGNVDFFSVRYCRRQDEQLRCRHGVVAPPELLEDEGVMITVHHRGGMGYSASSDVTDAGLRRAAEEALNWAELSSRIAVTDFSKVAMSHLAGEYMSPVVTAWDSVPMADKIARLRTIDAALQGGDARIVDASAAVWRSRREQLYLTNNGGRIWQGIEKMIPLMDVTAHAGSEVQTRTFGGHGYSRQGGWEVLDHLQFDQQAPRLREEALALMAAEHCPSDTRDLLLAPDQMILQIHESIGHPLELDRILGDERNYAGTSFVTPDMFGTYQYGSPLLNVTFDPSRQEQLASFSFDDEGKRAERLHVIKDGMLLRPLGATVSAFRSGMEGMANARAERWNRPPIDRMANLNVEPGQSSLAEMIAQTERGVFMKTNCSWSIDDSRNKFQFGCEWAQLIEKGQLTRLVKKPNYRGISATFWRSLKAVGNNDTCEVMGTPFCGKGEPNQVITVGHASPTCLFGDVEVFGGV